MTYVVPVIETILDELIVDVTSKLAMPDCSFTAKSVFREVPNIPEIKSQTELLPAVFIFTGQESTDMDVRLDPEFMDETAKYLDLNIMFINPVIQDIEKVGRRMYSDIERAVTRFNWIVNHSTGEATVQVWLRGGIVWNGLANPAEAGGHMAFRIKYRVKLGNPFMRA
jgi:hypothetical protein